MDVVVADRITLSRYSSASGSVLYGYDLFQTEDYIAMIEDTRKHCDDDDDDYETDHLCWMSGIAYDYYEQYLSIILWLTKVAGSSIAVGYGVSFLFLYASFAGDFCSKIKAAAFGACIISFCSLLAVLSICGLCAAAEVKLCGFSAMSMILSIGFAVEYSVHVTFHFITAPGGNGAARVIYAMERLFAPTLQAFASSAIGIVMLAFSTFAFVQIYFFIPLILCLTLTYFYGTYMLPVLLHYVPQEMYGGVSHAGATESAAECKEGKDVATVHPSVELTIQNEIKNESQC